MSEVAEAERGRAQMETLEQAAKRLGLHRASLYRFAQQGRIRIYKIGRSSRVLVDDVDRLVFGDEKPPDDVDEPEEPEPLPMRRGPGRPRKERPADPRFAELAERLEEIARQVHEVADEAGRWR